MLTLLSKPWPLSFQLKLGTLIQEMAEAGAGDLAMSFLENGQPIAAVIVVRGDPSTVSAYLDAAAAVGDRIPIGPTDC